MQPWKIKGKQELHPEIGNRKREREVDKKYGNDIDAFPWSRGRSGSFEKLKKMQWITNGMQTAKGNTLVKTQTNGEREDEKRKRNDTKNDTVKDEETSTGRREITVSQWKREMILRKMTQPAEQQRSFSLISWSSLSRSIEKHGLSRWKEWAVPPALDIVAIITSPFSPSFDEKRSRERISRREESLDIVLCSCPVKVKDCVCVRMWLFFLPVTHYNWFVILSHLEWSLTVVKPFCHSGRRRKCLFSLISSFSHSFTASIV